MGLFRLNTIKSSFHLVVTTIILLMLIICLNFYLGTLTNSANNRFLDILQLEKTLYNTILAERSFMMNMSDQSGIDAMYDRLREEMTCFQLQLELPLLEERAVLFGELVHVKKDSIQLLSNVQQLLPELTGSVRYIHDHHLVYLRNFITRGRLIQDYDTGKQFQKSSVQSASELDIVKSAVDIRTSLLDLYTLFFEMERGQLSSDFKSAFDAKIKAFFQAVIEFEAFSLDAQDGLLVEELLYNGRNIETYYTRLLTNEINTRVLLRSLDENRKSLVHHLDSVRQQIKSSNDGLENNIRIFQVILLLVGFCLVLWLLYHSKKINHEFQRTVNETEKIQKDLAYRIPMAGQGFDEFQIVYDAMNSMARTINDQVQALEKDQKMLDIRVKDRTMELMKSNEKLKKEIQERIEAETARNELETKLIRAKKMEAIGTLAGGVAHDLNNILSGLVSYPELIMMDMAEDHPLRSAMQTIKASGEKSAAIVQDLLTLARRGVKVSDIVNMNHIIRQYLTSPEYQKLLLYHPGVVVETDLEENPLYILGSSVHLSKTVMNLVSNAAEAIEGGGKIQITTENRYLDRPIRGYDDVNEGDYVVFQISDTGSGISADDLERIFEPFYTKKVMGRSGTGLGMAVVWGTVKDHRGYIDVSSVEYQGTVFTLYFPVSRKDMVKTETVLTMDDYRGKGETVLVVDDVPEQREIAQQMLLKLGYRVHMAASGEEAIKHLKKHPVELILLDMIMDPGLDGLDTYKAILEFSPHQKAIIASGFSETDRVKALQKMGAGVYVKKPYTLEKIGLAVREELDRSPEIVPNE